MRHNLRFVLWSVAIALGCGRPARTQALAPTIIPHTLWQSHPALGHAADAARRNTRSGDSLAFRVSRLTVLGTLVDSTSTRPTDVVRLRLAEWKHGGAPGTRGLGIQLARISCRRCRGLWAGELGAGLVALEVASLPADVASSGSAGGAGMRLRIPLVGCAVSLSARPPGSDLRGRDWHYMGETNTAYDPGGHFLISMIGNYERLEASPAQLAAIARLGSRS